MAKGAIRAPGVAPGGAAVWLCCASVIKERARKVEMGAFSCSSSGLNSCQGKTNQDDPPLDRKEN